MSKYSMISRLQEEKKMKWLYHLLVQRQHSMSIITFFIVNKVKSLKKDPDC